MLQFLNHLAADPIQWQGRSRPAKPRLSGLGCVAAGVAAIFMVFHVDLVPNVSTMMTASISQAGERVEWSESLALIFDQFHGITEGPRWKGGDDQGGGVRSHLDEIAKGGASAMVRGKEDEYCDGLGKDKGLDSLFHFIFGNDVELNEKQHKNINKLSEYEHNDELDYYLRPLHAINRAKRTTIDNAFAVGQAVHCETLDPADATKNKVCGTTCLSVLSLVWALVLILFAPGKSGNSRKVLKIRPKLWFRNPSNIICTLSLLTVTLAARTNSPQAKNGDGLGNLHSKDTKPFGLEDKLASFDILSRASKLRGGGEGNNGNDMVGDISKVKSNVATYLSSIKVIQTLLHNGNNNEAVASIRDTVGTKALTEIEASMSSEDMSDFDSPFVRTSSGAVSPSDDVTDAQLADFITDTPTLPGAFDQLVEHTQDFANLLDTIDEGMFDFEPVTAKNAKHNRYSQMKSSGPNRRPSPIRFNLDARSGFSKFGSFLQNDAAVTEKHRIRQEALGVCDPKCEPADAACHCKKLFECVSHLNEYDLAVLTAGGYIETDPASDHFGNFTINAASLNLFEVDVGVRKKLARIKDKAAAGPTNINTCNEVLEELFTACPSGDTADCTANSNTETHQLSVEKICDAVKTPTKLLFEVVGDEFDGFVGDSSSGATCEPLSFDLCRDFAVQFERLYEGRGGDSHYANPMRKNPDVGHLSTDYSVQATKLRIQLQGTDHLNLAEVEVYDVENNNVARGKPATQNSDWFAYGVNRIASNAVDGNRASWSGTNKNEGAWLEIDLESTVQVKRIVIYNRGSHLDFWPYWKRLSNSDVTLRNEDDEVVWKYTIGDASELRAISLDVFDNIQLPTSYWYPQDENTGIVDRDTFGDSQGVEGNFALINPATGKALGLAGNECYGTNYVVCGSSTGTCASQPKDQALPSDVHEVRCCSNRPLYRELDSSEACPPEAKITTEEECRTAGLQVGGELRDGNVVIVPSNSNVPCGCSLQKTSRDIHFDTEFNKCDPKSGYMPVCKWAKRNAGCGDVWGVSTYDNGECFGSSTYEGAEEICESIGGRLCTETELLNDCTEGTDCYDDQHVWVSNRLTTLVESQNYDPLDSRQQFKITPDGELESAGCSGFSINAQSASDSKDCIGGSALGLGREKQQWRIGPKGRIDFNVDCSVHHVANLAITAVEDNDIKTMKGRNIYVSITNPTTRKAISTKMSSNTNSAEMPVHLDDHDSGDEHQLFRLLPSDDHVLIQSKVFPDRVLSTPDCGESGAQMTLVERQYCIRAKTWNNKDKCGRNRANCAGYVDVFVDSGDGYAMITEGNKLYQPGEWVFEEECFDRIVGIQVTANGRDNDIWVGEFEIRTQTGATEPDGNVIDPQWMELICKDCAGSTNTMPMVVVSVDRSLGEYASTHCERGAICELVPEDEKLFKRGLWKIKDGTMELHGCGKVATISAMEIPTVQEDEEAWNQKWTVAAYGAVLLPANGEENQEWEAHYVDAPYNYALLPGFPGVGLPCLARVTDSTVFKAIIHQCDKSMALLVGSQTSLGTLRKIVDEVDEFGPSRMPGSCCFDSATTNDRYFGIDYDPNIMLCQNKGPFHLGISEEACHNAGGRWFRNPCLTLKECIDNRPSKFDLKNPIEKDCQDTFGQPNIAYVSTSASDIAADHAEASCVEMGGILSSYDKNKANDGSTIRYCCPEGCGECGGSGCDEFSLGAENCCIGNIEHKCETEWTAGFAVPASKLRIQLQGRNSLNLAEVEVYDEEDKNVARGKPATQSSILHAYGEDRVASNAVDGDHLTWSATENNEGAWLEIDLESTVQVKRIVIYNRDNQWDFWPHWDRLSKSDVTLRNEEDDVVWQYSIGNATLLSMLSVPTSLGETGSTPCRFYIKPFEQSCLEFCQSLPGYGYGGNQIAMMTDQSSSVSSDPQCICMYQEGSLPEEEELPEHATRSLPAFHLTNSGSVLGLGTNDCSATEIGVELQKRVDGKSQQFHLSYDNQIVSVACPNLVLTADCSSGKISFQSYRDTTWNRQKWSFADDNTIFNSECQTMKISAITDDIESLALESFYFSLINPSTSLAMGIDGVCEEGTSIVLQKAIGGSPGQQFYMEEESNVVWSLMCPGMAIGQNLDTCNSTAIHLTRLSDESEWTFNNDASIESKVSCAGKVIDINTNGKLSAVTGAPLILSNHSQDTFSMYQRWETSHQKLAVLSGPYAFVQPSSGLAIGIEASDDTCAISGTALVAQQDSYSANFHLGNSGEIHFSICPGLLLAIDSAVACDGSRLRLQTATGDDSTKWKINDDGTISSIKCPNHFVKIDGGSNAEVGAVILLRSNESSERQPWVKVNTRLTEDADTAILGNWNTQWSIDFGHAGLPLARDGNLYDAVCGSSESTSERSCAGQIKTAHSSEEYAVRCCSENGYELLDKSSDRCNQTLEDLLIRSEDECREAGLLVGGRLRFGQVVVGSWDHVPCGCSLQGRKGDIHFDTNLDACEEGSGYTPVCKKIGWKKNAGCDVWGESELNGECHGNSTHEDARALCDSVGARLCTREELLEDCTRNSGCGYDRELVWSSTNGKQCYTANSAFSQSFEDFAGEIVIHDASDEEQCRHARAELGFGQDHPYDTEVCRVFDENMCDEHFTDVDHMTEGFGPPVFTEVNFEAPKYPEDPELIFNALPEHTPFQDHTPDPYNKKKILDLQKTHLILEQLLWAYKEWRAFTLDFFNADCGKIPSELCSPVVAGNGGVCFPHAAHVACREATRLFRVWAWAHEKAMEITYRSVKFAHAYSIIQPDVSISAAAYTTATFNGLKELDKWNQESLNTINNNIFRQHSDMREHLQDRHQAMTNDIVEFLEEATNILGNEFNKQNQWLDTILCKIYELNGAEQCYGTGKSVLDMVVEWPEDPTTLWDKMHRIEEATQGNQDVFASSVSGPSQRLVKEEMELDDDKAAIEGKIDKLEVGMKKSEHKMDAIESSIEKIEDKMNVLESSMDKIEVKMEDMKGAMDDMKGMMSQLIQAMTTATTDVGE